MRKKLQKTIHLTPRNLSFPFNIVELKDYVIEKQMKDPILLGITNQILTMNGKDVN